MKDLLHVVWGCKRGAGMVLFGYKCQGGTAQSPPKPSRSTTHTVQPLQKDLGSQDKGLTLSLAESLTYRP